MSVIATGVARIRSAETGQVFVIQPEELTWDVDGSEERSMGPEVTHVAQLDHPDLGELVWRLWEYPLGAVNDQETETASHQIIENFRLELGEGSPEDYDGNSEDVDQARVEALIEWFGARYEDPVHRTPYQTAEGGYQYIYGGPYGAREVLTENFPEEDDKVVEAAVDELEADGVTEWTRTAQPGDYGEDEYDEPPVDGGDDEGFVQRALDTIGDADAGAQFALDGHNRVELQGWSSTPEQLDPVLLEELRAATAVLLTALAGTNAHTEILAAAQRYAEAVTDPTLSIQRVYARGIGLENAARVTDDLISEQDVPPLPGPARHSVGTVIQLNATFVTATREGRSLVEAAAFYQRSPSGQAALNLATAELAKVVETATAMFGPLARDAVAKAAANVGKGQRPERSNQVGERLLGNLLHGLGVALKATGGAIAVKILGDGLVGTPAGLAAVQGVTAGTTAAWAFVVTYAEPLKLFAAATVQNLEWLSQITGWIMARRSKSS